MSADQRLGPDVLQNAHDLTVQVAHLLLGPPALVLQVDGPDAFTANEPYMPLGQTLISWRRLRTRSRTVRPRLDVFGSRIVLLMQDACLDDRLCRLCQSV